MGFTNSPLVSYTCISPNQSGARAYPITRISIHCVVGQCTIQGLGAWFAQQSTQASSNYGVAYDGKIGLFVPESNRSWCTSSRDNDNRAITIEVASDAKEPYGVRDAAFNALLDLLEDICRRNGKKRLTWIENKSEALAYTPAADELILTVHRWFANKSCPGTFLYDRHPQIAMEITKRLNTVSAPAPEPATPPTELADGMTLMLSGTKCYNGATAAEPYTTKSGTFFLWSAAAVSGRVRITISKEYVGVNGKATCWIDKADAEACAGVRPAADPAPAPAADPAPAASGCTVTLPVLSKGSKGEEVRALQILLNGRMDLRLQKDGSFGAATQKAVVDFQTKNDLTADGYVGAKTWSKLLNNE